MRLIDLVNIFPDKPWNFAYLSRNENISMRDILDNPSLGWHADKFNTNRSITAADAIANPQFPWDWDIISRKATIADVLGNPHIPWNWNILSECKYLNISIESVADTLELPWNWDVICKTGILYPSDFTDYPNIPWNWGLISNNIYMEWEDIFANPELAKKPWDMDAINKNKANKDYYYSYNVTAELLESDSFDEDDERIDWDIVSSNFDLEYILSHPQFPWDWSYVYTSSRITVDDILNHPTLDWDPNGLSEKCKICYILENPHMIWKWAHISAYNRNITVKYIFNNPDLPWNWDGLSMNSFGMPYYIDESKYRIINRVAIIKNELFAVVCGKT
jgi:hypothetical protein